MRADAGHRPTGWVADYSRWHRASRVTEAASAVAFWVVVALGPAGLVAINVLGLFVDQQEIASHLRVLADATPGSLGDVIARHLTVVARPTAGTWFVDALLVIASLWTVSTAVAMLLRGIQRGFGQPSGSFVVVRPIGGALGLSAIVVVGTVATLLDTTSAFMRMVGAVVLAVAAFALIFGLYRIAIGRVVPPRALWPGALFAAIGLVLIQSFWEHLTRASPNLNLTYGSLANVVVSLLAIWLAAFVILLGTFVGPTVATHAHADD